MDSSDISDSELRIEILRHKPDELVHWFLDHCDDVFRTDGPKAADEFKHDLLHRLSEMLEPADDDAFARGLVQMWATTDLDPNGNRTELSRAERRRRCRNIQRDFDALGHHTKPSSAESPSPPDGMSIDANGELLMSEEKLAEVMEVPVEEIRNMIEENPGEFVTGFRPGVADDGSVVPWPVVEG